MKVVATSIRKRSIAGTPPNLEESAGRSGQLPSTVVTATTALRVAMIDDRRAISIALQAVGGGTVLQAVLERESHFIHWTVAIVGATDEYEVWVNTRGKVLRVISQPL